MPMLESGDRDKERSENAQPIEGCKAPSGTSKNGQVDPMPLPTPMLRTTILRLKDQRTSMEFHDHDQLIFSWEWKEGKYPRNQVDNLKIKGFMSEGVVDLID